MGAQPSTAEVAADDERQLERLLHPLEPAEDDRGKRGERRRAEKRAREATLAAERAAKELDGPPCRPGLTPREEKRRERAARKVLQVVAAAPEQPSSSASAAAGARREASQGGGWTLVALADLIRRADERAMRSNPKKRSALRKPMREEDWKRVLDVAFDRAQICQILDELGVREHGQLDDALRGGEEEQKQSEAKAETQQQTERAPRRVKPDCRSAAKKKKASEIKERTESVTAEPLDLDDAG